ncbi:LOW QUALITY PROTEIN: nuclear factor related to kappa-B-binding protein [Drosophila subobscura]|uniref:LOW QUALITY PROTEIN: nuclear factor related to kappa-B-binding protein n=1 Tax=Drosophila subobscura TaxID=7241 RepID=UPI00155A41FA|nr:LOW QUALITY PROTEIN: nuclear factor related to kappa-B-binding protein [Drosophila subobscura]
MSNNININSMLRPSLDSEEEEEDDIGQMSDGSSSSSGGSSNRSSSSSSSSAPGSLPEDDVDVEDEDMSDQDALSESETEDDTTTCQSDELELAQLSKRDTFRLPRGLCENSTIFHEFFSMETWQLLPQHVQARLQCLLPDFTGLVSAPQAGAEQQRTLVQLFNGGLQRFGQSPLLQLQRQLEDGNLRPDVLKLRRSIQHSSRREFRFQQAERLSQLAKELFLSREHMLKLAYTSSPPEEATASASKSMMPRPRKRKPPALSMENKLCSQRAKKRYVQELLEVIQELKVSPGEISAEEEDEECVDLMQRLPKMEAELKLEPTSVRSSNAADKKSIYNTFFKRRSGVDDEQVLRTMQAVRIQQLNDKNFKKYLRDYKRRKMEQPESPEFDTSEVRLRDICTRAQFVGSFKPGRKPKALLARLNPDPPALVPIGGIKNEPEDDIFVKEEPQQHQKQHRLQDYVPKEQMPKKMPPAAAAAPVPALIPKLEPISVPSATISNLTTISPTNPALKAAAVHIVGSPPNRGEVVRPAASPRPACYFSLLRDLFVSTPQHRLTYGELQLLLASWREKHSDAAIPTGDVTRIQQPDWSLLLQSAVNFLAADFGPLPAEYVPYIEHKTVLNIYQWIGAGRDSDARLCTLCQYWLRTQKEEQPIATTVHLNPCPGAMFIATTPVDASATQTLTPTPPPRCPTSWTVRTASQADMLEFQRQERLRFEYPHRPFTYRLNGYESVVGPVKGIYTQSLPLNKARGHAVMVDDRPPFVTILTLVRDATARLPNGEGTRSEISELLKCSQYVNHQAAENVLQTIVSGALDRMHGGIDPCVKYDAKRKIWIYLHRNRSEEEFERMHKHNLSLVKQKQQQRKQLAKPKKEDGDSSTELQDMPALVPSVGNPTPTAAPVSVSTAAGTLLHVKKTSPLPVKCPPVPPLKYNIPPANSNNNNNSTSSSQGAGMALSPTGANASPNSMQKSLLKPVPMGAVHRPMAGGTPVKTGNFAISKISPQRNTTPILVSTPSGMQTVHVATTPTSTQLGTSPTMSVNKKLTIKKPPTTSKIGNFIIPLDQQQQQQQQQQHSPQQHSQVLGKPKSMTISPRPQLSKNIIRLLPAGAAATGQVKSPQVQILGPRVVPQSTVRPVQQKIGAVSIISNKSVEASTSPITIATSSSSAVSAVSVGGGAGGTIVKMSPQAFATLQQQQLKQKAMGGTAKIASPVQTSPQQRILVGNTAISSNKKIVFQAMAKTTPKILTTTASSGGTTVRSPQQRIVLQNFKQAAAAGGGGATTVVSSTNATRMIRTSTTVSTAAGGAVNASQGGHIITLDSLLQKQNQQQHSGGKLLTTGSNIIQLATSSAGNVITLTPNQSQNTQPIQVQAKHLPTMARIVSATASGPTMVPKIIGKTTVLPGKPLLLHAKAIKQLGGGSVVTTQPTATTTTAGTNAVRTTQSIVIGGQTVKIQGAIPARSGGAPMQTVIMGNQLVRLAPSTSGSSSTNSNHLTTVASSGIATAPKTLLIGAGGTQTLRLAKNVLLTNKQGTSNSTGSSNATGTVTGGATAGNNLVFAVQGNGGQLFFSQGLQGMNLKPLSNMKVIPMVSAAGAAATAGGKITVTTTAKAEAKKLMPGTVLKTAPSGSGN